MMDGADVVRRNEVNDAELDALYRAEALGMTRLAFLMVGRRGIAEELVHDAFLAIQPRLRTGDITNPGGYLRTTVLNQCRMWLRRQTVEERERDETPVPTDLDHDEVALHLALRRLSDRQREAVVLRYFLDLPDPEIAEQLGCRPATVRSIVHRGLAILREELA